MIRARHREELHTHPGRPSDTLRNLNFELGVNVDPILYCFRPVFFKLFGT